MTHPKLIEFTAAEIAALDEDHRQLRRLSDFLWYDARPHEKNKFDMCDIARGWDIKRDEPSEAIKLIGRAADACGWEAVRSGDRDLHGRLLQVFGWYASRWMFSGGWKDFDNTSWGASWRIDHYLKNRHQAEEIYGAPKFVDLSRIYPKEGLFWMEPPRKASWLDVLLNRTNHD